MPLAAGYTGPLPSRANTGLPWADAILNALGNPASQLSPGVGVVTNPASIGGLTTRIFAPNLFKSLQRSEIPFTFRYGWGPAGNVVAGETVPRAMPKEAFLRNPNVLPREWVASGVDIWANPLQNRSTRELFTTILHEALHGKQLTKPIPRFTPEKEPALDYLRKVFNRDWRTGRLDPVRGYASRYENLPLSEYNVGVRPSPLGPKYGVDVQIPTFMPSDPAHAAIEKLAQDLLAQSRWYRR